MYLVTLRPGSQTPDSITFPIMPGTSTHTRWESWTPGPGDATLATRAMITVATSHKTSLLWPMPSSGFLIKAYLACPTVSEQLCSALLGF